ITGMGVISPVGNDVNTFWKNLCEGYCGIDYITEYPTDELPVRSPNS
ncbi:MAG: beta-ketoacyl-[Spirochaetaceae bacterium]|nr:beta-ketoacyl-[acyl-carrier-protein] synthase II [Spirochaetaceae bacterium]